MPLMMMSFICSCRNKIGVTMRMSGGRNALCNGDHGYQRHKRKSNWIYIQNNNSSWLGWSRTIPTSLHYITLALPAPKTAQPRREPQTHSKTIANKELRAHTTHHPRERTINNNIQTSNKYPLYTINTRRMSTGALDPRWTRDVNALTLPLQVTRSPVLHHSSEGRKRPILAPSDLPPPVGPLRRSRPCPCAAMMTSFICSCRNKI